MVCGPMREERLQAGEQGWGPQSLVLLPSHPLHALGPGAEVETDIALSRQKMYGPGGREGGASGKRRGRETA